METWVWLLFFGVYTLAIQTCSRLMFFYFKREKWLTINYQGAVIVQSFGVNIILHYFLYVVLFHFVQHLVLSTEWIGFQTFLFILYLIVLTIMGWMDDWYGKKNIKGIKGHLNALIQQRTYSTGILKIIIGSLSSLIVAYYLSGGWWEWMLCSAVLILSIHLFNLLDVRPGRSIKGFWLMLLMFILPVLSWEQAFTMVIPIILSTVVIFAYDRQRLAMLGDTGSNVLGGIFGFYVISTAHVGVQLVIFSLFACLSIVAEKHSFTHYIDKKSWLSKLDHWGIVD